MRFPVVFSPALLILLFFFSDCSKTQKTDPQSDLYTLVWEENFDGDSLDINSWSYHLGTGAQYGLNGWGNNELQYYTDRKDNVYLKNGYLVIEAKKEDFEDREYTSGKILTQNKHDWLHGKIEVRAKLPETQGIWPAIWMLPTKNEYGWWPASGEIDIMELLGHQPDTVYATIHYGNSFEDRGHNTGKYYLTGSSFADDFHTYAIDWEPGIIIWFIDGEKYHQANTTTIKPFTWPFDKSFHLILNVAVGGYWPGYPDETTVFPQRMTVDYVRVYQKS